MSFSKYVLDNTNKELSTLDNKEIYKQLLNYVKEEADKKAHNNDKKKVYYISAEFLIGKLLSNNLINLGIYEEIEKELKAANKRLSDVEEAELEPSLGNGGLGRLASCFIDSISSLGINGDGVGLNYHCGLFRQVFVKNEQHAEPNFWIEDSSWLRDTDVKYTVPFKNFNLTSTLKRIDVLGYKKDTKNYLNLFDIDSIDSSIIEKGISFDKTEIEKNLTLFLYPDDSDKNGELLRIYQQYFMVSNAAQLILDEAIAKGSNVHDLYEYAYVQINDTHPSMVIPELIRLLTEKHGIEFEEAYTIVQKMTGYTNHTILAEALEKWPLAYLEEVVPHLVTIIKQLDAVIREKYEGEDIQIIDKDDRVHMANMDIHFSNSVNGVAYLHTEILKNSELKHFYELYPEKFNNKTNGITFRRWLEFSNRPLAAYLKDLIGDEYLTDATKLEKLLAFVDSKEVAAKLEEIKYENKLVLKEYLKETQGIELDENSIIDTQIKRFHEYKRQQMNALYVIKKYLDIKNGKLPERKITVFFGGKAAPAYIIAQDIIHLILCLSELINNDPEVNKYLNVYLVENYNVGLAEKIIPATDISEQISLASKEASGTGNMKFMLNGALTLGTMDGANVEIVEEVGLENAFIFGLSAQEVENYQANGGYNPFDEYNNVEGLKKVIDQLGDGTYDDNHTGIFKELQNSLLYGVDGSRPDVYFLLKDFASYREAQDRLQKQFKDKREWTRKALKNIANAGKFSSDRTIAEYAKEIWNIEPVEVEDYIVEDYIEK